MFKTSTIVVFLLTVFNVRCQNTIVFDATKDTYINTVIADQVQGQVQSIIASAWTYGGSYGQGRSLIGFELCDLPEDFVLVSATLHLSFDYSGSHSGHTTNGLNEAKLFPITSYWDESTTWSNQPTYDPNTFAVLPSSNSNNEAYSVDVTSILSNTLTNSTEVGFYFRLDDEQIYRSLVFASSDHPDASIHPKLEIEFFTDSAWCGSTPDPVINPPNDTTVVIAPEPCTINPYIPNVFTPNNDFINDVYKIKVDCAPTTFQVVIVNRWGGLVFQSNDYQFEWNGKNSDGTKELSEGTYFYKVEYSDSQQAEVKSGFVELVR